MKVLFLSAVNISNINNRNIYTDLLREFLKNGHEIIAVSPVERRNKKKTSIINNGALKLLQIKTPNLQKTNIIEKGISTLLIGQYFKRIIVKYFDNINFDLVLHTTPPITFTNVIKYYKDKYETYSYLLLKDIFPQNTVDLGYLKNNGFIHKYFRNKEKQLYASSDFIGCMSPKNRQYLLENNSELNESIVEVNPNSIEIIKRRLNTIERKKIRDKYSISGNDVVFIYGGNLGAPQGISFLIEILRANQNKKNVFFMIVGSGTGYSMVKAFISKTTTNNVLLLPLQDIIYYNDLVLSADVGLILLDSRFTIPNFPSRLLSYLENRKPVLAGTDKATDLGSIITENNFGFWAESGDIKSFNKHIDNFINNRKIISQMGKIGFQYLVDNYSVESTYDKIVSHIS